MKPLVAILALSMAGMDASGQGQTPSIVSKAGLDFDKVDAAPVPTIQDTMSCVQSNAAALPATRAEERYLIHFRMGYCELFGAALTGNSGGFKAAAADFAEAIGTWPTRKMTAGPPAGLRALMSIARLEQGRIADAYPDMIRNLGAVTADANCAPTPVMSSAFCGSLIDTARIWLGWLAYRRSDFAQAAQQLQTVPGSAWSLFVSGRIAQDQKRLAEAAALYRKSLDAWAAARKSSSPDAATLLGPRLETAVVHYQLGLIEYSSQRYEAAVARFDEVFRESPENSYAIYLRARSKEALRLYGPALEDYALAAQTARANNDSSWSIGQAHFARGVLLYRAKDFGRAEPEFASALVARLTEVTQADASAWRAMSAVAGGACRTSVEALESSARAASDQFPKSEAEALVIDCRLKQAANLEQYLAVEKQYAGRLDATKLRDLRNLIASAYADQAVAAEDRKDPYSAVAAYRRALEWNPASAKARFNLGAIYIADKRYNLAEAEYRALVEADASDYEAHYWLGQSILAQRPPADRVAAACEFLRRSVAIGDADKKAQFTKALATAKCPN